jgi:anti-anti-sigma regulatory factor
MMTTATTAVGWTGGWKGVAALAASFLVVVTEGVPNVIRLGGSLDEMTARQLQGAYARLRGDVEIDCEHLDDVDLAGLEALLEAQRAVERRGYRFALRSLPERCVRAAERQGLAEALRLA